jgi:hypothetical protein
MWVMPEHIWDKDTFEQSREVAPAKPRKITNKAADTNPLPLDRHRNHASKSGAHGKGDEPNESLKIKIPVLKKKEKSSNKEISREGEAAADEELGDDKVSHQTDDAEGNE